jgi:pimeloyl-ACP methyl ester carboxylesterase
MTDDWRSGFVEANGIRLHYTRTDGDKPPLVLAHGVTDAGPCWTAVAEALAAEYDAIMVDAHGHGYSDAQKRGYVPEEQVGGLRWRHPWPRVEASGTASRNSRRPEASDRRQ